MSDSLTNFGIIGAGIGGLALSIFLRNIGHSVTVFERSSIISSFGAGVQLSPNGVKILRLLGVEEATTKLASSAESLIIRRGENNKLIAQIPLGQNSMNRYQAPFLQIHRSDLTSVLFQKALQCKVNFKFGNEAVVKTVNEQYSSITSGGQNFCFDSVIAADGVHSITRKKFFKESEPRFLNQVAYRAMIPLDQVPISWRKPQIKMFLGRGSHVVVYPLSSRSVLNLVLCNDERVWTSDGWTNSADSFEICDRFCDFKEVSDILDKITSAQKWGLLGYENKRDWHLKNLCLLGDACHPMLPYLAQGANQALEDAASLAHYIFQGPSNKISKAFELYGKDRRDRVIRVQKASRQNAKLYHLSNSVLRFFVYSVLSWVSMVNSSFLLSKLDWLYNHKISR